MADLFSIAEIIGAPAVSARANGTVVTARTTLIVTVTTKTTTTV